MTVEQETATLNLGPEVLTFRAFGDTLRLVAEASDANGHPMKLVWMSSDATVVQVDAAGLVTAVGNGSTTVTVTAGEAVRSAVVVVEQVAVVLDLAPEAVRFRALGDTVRLVAEAADANGHAIESVTWTSGNMMVATVDSTGLVTAGGNGSARIAATASGQTSSATVTVEQEAVALVGLPMADTLLWYGEPGDTLRLMVTGTVDANGHPVEGVPVERIAVEWTTNLAGVATVDDAGLVLGAAEGVATITATAASLGLAASTELVVVNRDRAALVAFYHATGGPDWWCNGKWTTQALMADWCGVRTTVRPDGVEMVTEISLRRTNLTGPIPPELASLASLRLLDLHNNQLTGAIPPELGNLANLELLDLSGHTTGELTGPIPPELGRLANLRSLDFGGAVPSGRGNHFTGPIPPELGNFVNLRELSLAYNQLTGQIPPELGNITVINSLNLSGNQLTGPIPPELGRLNFFGGYGYLSLANNQLTGPIPSELANIYWLRSLNLSGNQLTGPIPPELSNSNVSFLRLQGNATLGGRLPVTFTQLELHTFYWDDTRLCHPPTAAFQRWLQNIRRHRGGPPCGS